METTTFLQEQLDRLRDGHPSARNVLLDHSVERFRLLARKMFRKVSDLRRLDETDDVLQKALVRLNRALESVKPVNVLAYCALASQQIRWVLRDLARQMGTAGSVVLVGDDEQERAVDGGGEPRDVLEWSEFHAKVETLPEDERQVFDLLFYEGMNQPEASALLGVPLRTLKRRWQSARLRLREALRGEWPSMEGSGNG